MRNRTISGMTVGAIGPGGMPMSIEGRPDEARSIRTIHAALDAGVTLIDTADAYHMLAGETGHNERLIAKARRRPHPHDHERFCTPCRTRSFMIMKLRPGSAARPGVGHQTTFSGPAPQQTP